MLFAVLSIFLGAALSPLVVRVSRQAAGWILGLLPLGVFVFFARQLPAIAHGETVRQSMQWLPSFNTPLSFYLDGLSLLFALLVTGIGTLIVVYAGGYLAHHDQLGRFYVQLLSFMGAMLGLVLADNIFVFFIFFELTSLTSYLLIGFYHTEEESRVAARKALVVTGGGGLALLGGLLLLGLVTGTMEFSQMLSMGAAVQSHPYYLAIFILVCAGAFTKSAQFPFHFWLPAAMAGPTPVSAYLHSATMVKAGVFLLARLSPVLGGTAVWEGTLGIVGGFTMLMSAWLALRYTDLKQILAYTTVMVLGLLTMLLGVGGEHAITAMVTFTVVHALYKGGLFMMAGSVDHETGTRNVRELGGLRNAMPWTMAGAVATGLSMAGIPPLFGFIGKEMVYEAALHADSFGIVLLGVSVLANVALVGSGLVVGLKPFIGEQKGAFTREPHEAPVSMWLGPLVLGALGLAFGLYPALIDHSLLQAAQTGILQESHELHLALWHGFTPALMASLVTFALGFTVYATWESIQESGLMAGLGTAFGSGPGRVFERGLYGLARFSQNITLLFQNGRFRWYLFATFTSLIVLVGGGLAFEAQLGWPAFEGEVAYYEGALAALIVLSALVAVRTQGRFIAILALSVGGYGVALIYLLFGAPDLAMTQFAIETLTLILLVIVIIHLPGIEGEEPLGVRLRDGLAALGCGVVYTLIMSVIIDVPLNRRVSEYLANNSYTEALGHNIVNVILVDFRGIDTMGEITVLTIAAIGVFVLMRMPRRNAHEEEADEEEAEAEAVEGERVGEEEGIG
jgi:multicomponent Na+:H+ antiporter subunit A